MFFKNSYRSIIILILFVSLFYTYNFVTVKKDVLANVYNNKLNVEVFKTPSCGCCYGYVLFLEKEKFNVKQTDMRSLHSIKQKYNIPVEMQSCHTTIIGKYFIEGHVPLEAINKLLEEQPSIDGIALPGMPIGTPGMPGKKEEPYIIYQLIDGKFSVFMTI
tara:strand:- start:336 stop:818 length:483 start_codon:yes stop_codon:yes gene_type:complete